MKTLLAITLFVSLFVMSGCGGASANQNANANANVNKAADQPVNASVAKALSDMERLQKTQNTSDADRMAKWKSESDDLIAKAKEKEKIAADARKKCLEGEYERRTSGDTGPAKDCNSGPY